MAPEDLDAIDDTAADVRAPAAFDHRALLTALRSATTAHGRFSCVGAYDLGRLEPAQALRVLDAVPAGWQRRRVAERLLASGALDGVDAGRFLQRFPGAADARFVIGSAVDRGTLTIPELTEHLPEEAIRRLHTRTGT